MASLLSWAKGGPEPLGVEVLKVGNVLRRGEYVLKLVEEQGLKSILRPTPLWRNVHVWEKHSSNCLRFPRPHCLATCSDGDRRLVLYISEYLQGPDLWCCWVRFKHYSLEKKAIATFPLFMAHLHNTGLLHGDLHPANLIWTRDAWALIDLESIRYRISKHLSPRQVADQWARLYDKLRQPSEVWAWLDIYIEARNDKLDPKSLRQQIQKKAIQLETKRSPRGHYDPEKYLD